MYRVAHGLGDANATAQQAQVAGSMAAGTATAILGSLTTGGATTVLGITAAAVPVIGAGLVAATLLVSYLIRNSGCGQTCIVTSQWANQAADALQKVKDAYFALPAPRTQAQKAVALANGQVIWEQLKKICGQPGTGNAGVRCITDRQPGACVWKQKYAPVHPGDPEIGECWNWDNGYFEAIRRDPVVPDPTPAEQLSAAGSAASSLFTAPDGSSYLPMLAVAALVVLAVSL
jgi:hypothetical protein